MSDESSEDNLLVAQYNQMWEWKRFNIRLCWQIPVMLAIVAGVAIRQDIGTLWEAVLLIPFVISMVGLFLRHMFFQGAIGHLISHLEIHRRCDGKLPKTGREFVDFCDKDKTKYPLNCCFRIGGLVPGYVWWGTLGLIFSLYLFVSLTK